VSILASSLLFTLAHGIDMQNIPLFVTRFAFGLLMGTLIVMTGGLEAAIAAHVANNLSTFTYAALNGGVAGARAITEATWEAAAWNIAAYALTGVLCWLLGNKLRVAKYTPAL
jgi:membrane protease YdiL (CAAX protease family)